MNAAPVVPVLEHAGCSAQCGTFLPEDDGPPVLVVGSLARDARLVALARRHGIDAGSLLLFARQGREAATASGTTVAAGP